MQIKVDYSGKYPNLCSGLLKVTLNGDVWEFPERCMCSGGTCHITEENDEETTRGEWSINRWPENFPEHLKKETLDAINVALPHGCCGGCI